MIVEIKDAHMYSDFRWQRLSPNTQLNPDRVVLAIFKQETEVDFAALNNLNAANNSIYDSIQFSEEFKKDRLFKVEIIHALTAVRRDDKFVQEMEKL